jgi:hypothetical protein
VIRWIAVSTSITTDPALDRFAVQLGVSPLTAVGHVVGILCHLPAHAKDGNLANVPDVTLEHWARWDGARGALAAAYRDEFCDADGTVHGWDDYNGAAIRKHEVDAERKRIERQNRRKTRQSGAASSGPSDGQSHGRPHVHNKTRQDIQSSSSARDMLLAAAPNRTAWEAEFRAILEGMPGHPAATAAQLDVAIAEYVANTDFSRERPSMRLFKGYVKRAAQPERPAPLGHSGGTTAQRTFRNSVRALEHE